MLTSLFLICPNTQLSVLSFLEAYNSISSFSTIFTQKTTLATLQTVTDFYTQTMFTHTCVCNVPTVTITQTAATASQTISNQGLMYYITGGVTMNSAGLIF